MSDVRVVFSVLSSKQFARRWRDCNPGSTDDFMPAEEDDEWRTCTLKLLSAAHTLGGVIDLSFDVVDSRYAVRLVVVLDRRLFYYSYSTYRILHLNWEAIHSNGDGKPVLWDRRSQPKSYPNIS